MAIGVKKVPLTEEQARKLILTAGSDVFEVPLQTWLTIEPFRRHQTFAVMGSANFDALKVLNGIPAFAAYDQLVAESKQYPGEPEGNAYHWVMAHIEHETHPYLWCGPFLDETRTDHWFELNKINVYYPDDNE